MPNTEKSQSLLYVSGPENLSYSRLSADVAASGPGIVQLPVSSPPVFGTDEFGKVCAWHPSVWMHLFSYI